MARLKPLKKQEDISAIPQNQAVLVELPSAPSAVIEDDAAANAPEPKKVQAVEKTDDDTSAANLKEQLEASKEAQRLAEEDATRERQQREAVAQQLAQREAENRRLLSDREQSEESSIANGLAAAQAEQAAAEADLERAFQAGDAKQVAAANAKIAKAASRVDRFETAQADLVERKQQATIRTETQRQQPQQQISVDIATEIDRMNNLMPKEKAWLKQHPELVTDPARFHELTVGYNHALRDGHSRGTEGYFKYMDQFLGYAKPMQAAEQTDEDDAIMAAPVSRDEPSVSGQRPVNGSRIVLTPEDRELAANLGISELELAQQKAKLAAVKKDDPARYNSR